MLVNARADDGVEGSDDALDRRANFGLEFDELDEDVARELIDGKDDVAVSADR